MINLKLNPDALTADCSGCYTTVNREIIIVKMFLNRMGNAKIKFTKIMHIINTNAVRAFVPKLFNTKIYRTKYF